MQQNSQMQGNPMQQPTPAPMGGIGTWDCTCGQRGNVGNFCSNCGSKKPEAIGTWDCSCGNKGNTGNFCNNCGEKRGE